MHNEQIVYHVNMGTEKIQIKKLYGLVASCNRIEQEKIWYANGWNYQIIVCIIENLRENLEDNSSQLSLF